MLALTKVAYILAQVLILSAPLTRVVAQTPSDLGDGSTVNFKVENVAIYEALAKLAREYKVPIGFEEDLAARPSQPMTKISVALSGVTVREAIQAIVNQDSSYVWNINDGVINVVPKTGQDNILGVMVPRLELNLADSAGSFAKITSLSEVSRKMETLGVRPLRIEMGGLADTNPAPIPLLIEGVPVRAALNEIAKRTNAHFWIVARLGKKGEYLIIDF